MNRHFVVAGILSGLLICVGCNSSNDGVTFFESLKEERSPHPLSLKQRLQALTPVFDSFADALAKIASKYPEMAGYSRDKAINQSEDTISCGHSHNFTRPHVKRGILPSDFGENGFTIRLSCKAMPLLHHPAYAMSPPALQLDNLQFYIWTEIGMGSNPSPGLVDEANAIIQSHLDKLTEADRIASDKGVQEMRKTTTLLETSCTATGSILTEEIPAEQTSIMPKTDVVYTLSPPSIFNGQTRPGPAEMETSMAWRLAIEFVFRTKLRELCEPLPYNATASAVTFYTKDRKAEFVVLTDVKKHTLRIKESPPAISIVNDDPNKIQVVLEILDRPAFRAAMPADKKITLEEYRKIKHKYISNNERWRSGFVFTYRSKEDDGWRGYWLALVSFNGKSACIAELTQFKSRGWDWVALYRLDRCDEVDKDFVVAKIVEERSRVIGGVRYGMSMADVIELKGKHFKVNNHAHYCPIIS